MSIAKIIGEEENPILEEVSKRLYAYSAEMEIAQRARLGPLERRKIDWNTAKDIVEFIAREYQVKVR